METLLKAVKAALMEALRADNMNDVGMLAKVASKLAGHDEYGPLTRDTLDPDRYGDVVREPWKDWAQSEVHRMMSEQAHKDWRNRRGSSSRVCVPLSASDRMWLDMAARESSTQPADFVKRIIHDRMNGRAELFDLKVRAERARVARAEAKLREAEAARLAAKAG